MPLAQDWFNLAVAEAIQEAVSTQIQAEPPKILHDYQRAPSDNDWLIWILKGGRGSGKTLAGAEWIWSQAQRYPYVGIAAATFGDGRDYCIEGESGLKT
jgi:phage terminase large subunit-like protein